MKYAFISLLIIGLFSCAEEVKEKKTPEWNTEKSTKMNEELALEEDLDIRLYLAQHENWKVQETGTGLRFVLFKETKGDQALPGMDAKVQYSIKLLDGTEIYKTPEDELDIFNIDNSEVESGIHEGIKRMRVGEKALFVFPSHLAHGLVGDMAKIPPLSPMVVEIELIELEK